MSKLILYDWRCTECSVKFEALEKMSVVTHVCPECGATANRLISAPHFDPKMGLDPDFRTFGDKWAKKNKQKTEQDKTFYKEHGADKKHHSYGS